MEAGDITGSSSSYHEQKKEGFNLFEDQLILDNQEQKPSRDVQTIKEAYLKNDVENLGKKLNGYDSESADVEENSDHTLSESSQHSQQEDCYYEHQGFYCLVSVVEEEQNAEIVAKITTIKEQIHQLCQDLLPLSSKMAGQEIDFDSLNSLAIQCIGICGTQPAILDYIQKHQSTQGLHHHLQNDMNKKPGLYLWVPRIDIDEFITVYLILWPLPQYLKYLQRACAYTSLFRYVVEMCSDVLCVFGENELKEFSPENYPFVQQINLGGVGFHWVRKTETKADVFPVEGGLRKDFVLKNDDVQDAIIEQSYVAKCERLPTIVSSCVLPQRVVPKKQSKIISFEEYLQFFNNCLNKNKIVFEEKLLNQLNKGDINSLQNNSLVLFLERADQDLYAEFQDVVQQAKNTDSINKKTNVQEKIQTENQEKIDQFEHVLEFYINEFLHMESKKISSFKSDKSSKIEKLRQLTETIQKEAQCKDCCQQFVAKSNNAREPVLLKNQDVFCRTCAIAQFENVLQENEAQEKFKACENMYKQLESLEQNRNKLTIMSEQFQRELNELKLEESEKFEILKKQLNIEKLKFAKIDFQDHLELTAVGVMEEMTKAVLEACVLKQYYSTKNQQYNQFSKQELAMKIFNKSIQVNIDQSKPFWQAPIATIKATIKGFFSYDTNKNDTNKNNTWEVRLDEFRQILDQPESEERQILNELFKKQLTYQLKCDYQNILHKQSNNRMKQIQNELDKPVLQIPAIQKKIKNFKEKLVSFCAQNIDLPEVKIISIEKLKNQFRIQYEEKVSAPSDRQYVIQTFQPVKNEEQSILQPYKVGHITINQNYQIVFLCPAIGSNSTKFIIVVCGKNANGQLFTGVHVANKLNQYKVDEKSAKLRLTGKISQVSFDSQLNLLYLYNGGNGVLETYEFEKDFGSVIFVLKDEKLGQSLKDISQVISIPGKKELLLVANEGVYIYRVKAKTLRSGMIPVKRSIEYFMVTPDGSMVISLYQDEQKWMYDVYSLNPLIEMIKEKQIFDGFDGFTGQEASFWVIEVSGKSYIYGCSNKDKEVMVKCVEIKINSLTQKNILTPEAAEELENKRVVSNCESNSLLDYIYYIFEKFPGRSALGSVPTPTHFRVLVPAESSEQTTKDISAYLQRIWSEVQQNTRKDFTGVEFQWTVLYSNNFQFESLTCNEFLGDWLIRFICLVPVQICRCEEHTLIPLSDNQFLEINHEATKIEEIAESISFGLYDSIFKSPQCCNLPTIVVSSMGLQSTGKSYQLCHLGGCLFDVSGSRCTDGCWMTARIVNTENSGKKLMVFLDFEGLGSQERHESEDMLLSLFSGAVSHLTMFKTDLDFNRDVEKTLRRFNLGASKVKNMCGASVNQVFTGSFMFCLKDVQTTAVSESIKEFEKKISRMINEDDNYLNSMYSGEVRIVDFAYLENEQFYRQLSWVANNFILNQTWLDKRGLSSSQKFLGLMKMLLAKISNKDWTPLDRNQIRERMEILNRNFVTACEYGCIVQGETLDNASDLLDYDTQTPIQNVDQIFIELRLPLMAVGDMHDMYEQNKEHLRFQIQNINEQNVKMKIQLPDKQLYLGDPNKSNSIQNIGKEITRLFMDIFEIDTSLFEPKDFDLLRTAQEKFAKALIERRQKHVKTWIQKNTKHFAEDSEAIQWSVRLDSFFVPLLQNTKLCTNKCAECFLLCQLAIVHDGDHDCSTDHKCKLECKYCEDITDAEVKCCEKSGHPGPHTCGSQKHQCGQVCSLFQDSRNCAKKCIGLPGHEGQHKCGSAAHLCNHQCELLDCQEMCKFEFGVDHDRHECSMGGCPKTCQLCNRRCVSENHFHEELQDAVHLCEQTHKCIDPNTNQQKLCSCDGVCEVDSRIIKENRLFNGQREQFMYEHRTQQFVKRKPCGKIIPQGSLFHEGPCVCSTDRNVVHFCGHPCPSCKYLCTEPYAHHGRHNTQHGNMINSMFISDQDDIDFDGHKYRRGETSTPILCDLSCVQKGRHIHTIYCIPERCRSNIFDGHRHSDVDYSDGSKKIEVDELTHDAYYELIDFKDPCQERYQQQFRLCPATCGSQAHDNETDQDGMPVIIRCKLPLWHDPEVNGIVPAGESGGYVSLNGHYFPCQHTGGYTRCSTYLIIDRSGSMSNNEVRPLSPQIRNHPNFIHGNGKEYFDNCLGLVYEAVMTFVSERNNMCSEDVVSFVPFNDLGEVVISELLVSEAHILLNQMLQTVSGGGTNFCSGLQAAYDDLLQKRQNNPNQIFRQPVFIILSDSMDHQKQQFLNYLQQIMDKEQNEQGGLTVHALGFGNYVDERFLEQITDVGKGGYRVVGMQNSQQMINDLSQTFAAIAEKPGSHIGFINLNS